MESKSTEIPPSHQCVFKTKQNIFDLFSPVQANSFSFETCTLFACFPVSSTLKTLMEGTVYKSFSVAVFKSLVFHLSILERSVFKTMRLQKPFEIF